MTTTLPAVRAEEPANLPALPFTNPFDITAPVEGAGVWTSLDLSSEKGKRLAMTAATGATEAISDHIGETLEIQDVLVHGVDLADTETGEIITQARVVLFAPNGASYQCVSGGVVKALRYLASLYGKPPWKPAMRLIPRQQQTSNKRRYFTLEVAPEKGNSASGK